MDNNISRIYIADVKLNETDKDYKRMLIIENENGSLFVDKELFVISFMPNDAVTAIVKNKTNLINVDV